jgi:hypothetical protein
MRLGMDTDCNHLVDGICTNEVLVRAPAERIAARLGTPQCLMSDGTLHVAARVRRAVAFVARPKISDWCVVEVVGGRPGSRRGDYLAPMFDQALAAIQGKVPRVEPAYVTPVTTAGTLSRRLKAPAIGLWGSDECPGLGGGVIFRRDGAIEAVYTEYSRDEIVRARASHQGRPGGDDGGPASDGFVTYRYSPGGSMTRTQDSFLEVLDRELKRLGAAEPMDPLEPAWPLTLKSLVDYSEFWCAVARAK